jgi:hypothetical protein
VSWLSWAVFARLSRVQVNIFSLIGKVARDFWPLVFFMNQPHIGPWFMLQNIFGFYFEFESGSAEQKTVFKIGGFLSMDTISLG